MNDINIKELFYTNGKIDLVKVELFITEAIESGEATSAMYRMQRLFNLGAEHIINDNLLVNLFIPMDDEYRNLNREASQG